MPIGSDGHIPTAPGRFLVLSMRMRERRRALGLTQQQVVRRLAGIGVTTSNKALSSLEHGAGIDAAKLPEFAAALECTVTYLLGLTDDPSNWEPETSIGSPVLPIGRATPAPVPRERDEHNGTPAPAPTDVPASGVGKPPAHSERPAAGKSWILGPYPQSQGG